jgi:hypothetical protein
VSAATRAIEIIRVAKNNADDARQVALLLPVETQSRPK